MNAIDPVWAWQEYVPGPTAPWDLKKAGHLHRRAGFGADRATLDRTVKEGPKAAIDRLLQPTTDATGDDVWNRVSQVIIQQNNGQQISALWLYRLIFTRDPLREKMTLFWHNHFATSNAKVRSVRHMLGQCDLMRRHALGHFRPLLEQMSRDPAMLVWLDTHTSQKNQPNENYARELMELFSLGISHPLRPNDRNYTEADIREAARAFTGWRIVDNRAVFQADQHDAGAKNVLGQRGNWKGDDIVRICLEQEAGGYYVVKKLFRFLVSDTIAPTGDLLQPLAQSFRQSDFDFGKLVERVLRSNLFFSNQAYRTRIKSPVDFALGIIHGLEGPQETGSGRRLDTVQIASALEGLGQRLFHPPSVAGWDGGPAWLNAQTLLLRHNLALALTSTLDDRFGRRLDPALLTERHKIPEGGLVDFFLTLFLQNDVPAETRQRLVEYVEQAKKNKVPVYWLPEDAAHQRVRALCHLVLTLPEFQLD